MSIVPEVGKGRLVQLFRRLKIKIVDNIFLKLEMVNLSLALPHNKKLYIE